MSDINLKQREVFSHIPSSVAVITANTPDGPAGLVVGTVTSVSMDPPVMSFSVMQTSRAWSIIRRETDLFGVNILSSEQHELPGMLMRPPAERFDGIDWTPSEEGLPRIAGTSAWIVCRIDAILPAGDHDIVIGSVRDMSLVEGDEPLVFLGGQYSKLSLDDAVGVNIGSRKETAS